MNSKGRCHLEPLSLARIQDNPLLSVAVRDDDVQRCMTNVKQYGVLDPLVLCRTEEGNYTIIAGSCELQALRKMKVSRTDAVVVGELNRSQAHQLSLQLLSLRSSKDSLSEAFLVQKLLQDPRLSQSDVAIMVGRSVSWVSKRALLAERLSTSVQKMVIEKLLPARTAQEIAKLPPETQHSFATRVVSEAMPKSAVEHLVATYNHSDTTAAVKRQILENPRQTLLYCVPKKSSKSDVTEEASQTKHLHNCIRLLLNLTSELESLWTSIPITDHIWLGFLNALQRLSDLSGPNSTFAPGQELKGDYHAN